MLDPQSGIFLCQQLILRMHFLVTLLPFFNPCYFCLIDYAKAFNHVDHNKLWKILKEMGIPDHLQVRKQQLELDMEQQAGSK